MDMLSAGSEREMWETTFKEFCHVWNNHLQYVKQYECLRLPTEYQGVDMGRDTPLAFCLLSDKDEGITVLAFIGYLVELHNFILQAVFEELVKSGRHVEQHSKGRPASVQSRHLTAAQTIRYDLHAITTFFEKQCFHLSHSGGIHYDFGKAQARLIDRYLTGLPVIELQAPLFAFTQEQTVGGNMSTFKQKVRQEPLPRDVEEAIRAQTSPSAAQTCLETVETSVSFLASTGGSFVQELHSGVSEMLLSKYLETVLLMPEVNIELPSRVVVQEVRLKHLEGLWGLLIELTNVDMFANIPSKYRQPLLPEDELELQSALTSLKLDILLPTLKGYMISYLVVSWLL